MTAPLGAEGDQAVAAETHDRSPYVLGSIVT